MNLLTVSPSPHIHNRRTTQKIMLDVIIALIPSAVASIILFGIRSVFILLCGIFVSFISEFVFNLILKRPQTVMDLSSIVSGIILSLSLPADMPLWQVATGALFSIIVVKCLFGGIGKNFANPAGTARVFLLLSFSKDIAGAQPIIADTFSAATPLTLIKNGAMHKLPSLTDMLLGIRGGAIGEGCILAIIIGFVYMIIRRVITPHAPLGFILGLVTLSLLFGRNPMYEIISGGAAFAAVFMATDYSSTPINKCGRLIFGIGCGVITMLIRAFGIYPEGVSFALLFMNILTPYIDKLTRRRALGGI